MTEFKQVELASVDDIYDLVPLVRKFWKEGNYKFVKFDPKFVAESMIKFISNPSCRCFVAKSTDDDVVGMLMGIIHPQAFSTDNAAYEIAWFVDKEARGTPAATSLLAEYEKWAKENNCTFINMSRIEGVGDEKVDAMYKKLNFRVLEYTYIKEL